MRIAYLCSRYPAVSHTFVMAEVHALRRRGVEVDTFTIRHPDAGEVLSSADREAHRTTTAVVPPALSLLLTAHLLALARRPGRYIATLAHAISLTRGGARARLWQLFYFAEAMLLWRACARRGISHVHVHFANVAADVALLAAHYGSGGAGLRSWSFTMHGPTEFYGVDEHRLREKVEAAEFVACTSDFARSQLMGFVERSHWRKLHVVHCGVDPAEWRQPPPAGENEQVRVLSVGRLVQRKGQAVLLDAVALLRNDGRDVTATIVGGGPERQALEGQASDLGIESAIDFTGAIGGDHIRAFYECTDLVCAPSFAEGVPVVLVEAMAMGLPVVATRIMGVPELVEDGSAGLLVPPGRAEQLAAALGRLADDPELRRRMGVAGRRHVCAEYDVHQQAAQLEAFFRSAATPQPTATLRALDRRRNVMKRPP